MPTSVTALLPPAGFGCVAVLAGKEGEQTYGMVFSSTTLRCSGAIDEIGFVKVRILSSHLFLRFSPQCR